MLQPPLEYSSLLKDGAILCSKNDTVEEINAKVVDKVVGEKITLFSADSIQSDLTGSSVNNVLEEYMHSLTTPGLPPAKLELKIGLPVMLLRNSNPERGLFNGARCIVHQIGSTVYLESEGIGGFIISDGAYRKVYFVKATQLAAFYSDTGAIFG